MDVTNQIQNGPIQHTSGNSNYSSGSGGDSPTSLSPGMEKLNKINLYFSFISSSYVIRWTIWWKF